MCAPGTIEAVRERFEEDESFVRIDRRKALLAGAGAAVAAAFPVVAKAAPAKPAAGRAQDLTHVFAESLPLFADIFPRPTRDTFVTVPNDGFYGQVWRFWEHTGTHLDVPAHFIQNGRTTPLFGSSERRVEGNTNCHAHSKRARGYFRASAWGSHTSPKPSLRSR